MPTFVTFKSAARLHGVAAIEVSPPAAITATGTGNVVIVDAFTWGPEQVLTYPSDPATLLNMVAPPGMSRTTTAYLSLIRKGFTKLGFVRVVAASGAVAGHVDIPDSVPTTAITLVGKYKGAAINGATAVVSTASDGNSNHYNLTVSITGASGTTTELFTNLDNQNTAAAYTTQIDFNKTVLLGAITKVTNTRPVNGTYTFASGSDGSLASADWTGTPGSADKGIALLEGDLTVDFVVPGQAGSFRAAVNAAAVAHADLMTDRMAVINGPSGQTAATAQTDVASYRSIRAIYVDPWVYILDESGNKTLVPPGPFAAAVASQLPPSTSIAWKAIDVQTMLKGIVDVEYGRGNSAADNTDAGIVTVTKELTGGFTFESAKNTFNPTDPRKGSIKRTRMGHFIARSVVSSLRPYVDSPNVPVNQDDEFEAVQEFLGQLKKNAADKNVNKLNHIADFSMVPTASINSQSDLDAGQFNIGANVKISSDQEHIFLQLAYGENVNPAVTVS